MDTPVRLKGNPETEKVKKLPGNLSESERRDRFETIITPNFPFIRSLVSYYTDHSQFVEENFNEVLFVFFKYIHTYDPSKSLKTWIHTVVKNNVRNINKARSKNNGFFYDGDIITTEVAEQKNSRGATASVAMNFADELPDDLYNALLTLPPHIFSAFMLRYQGYDLNEIVEIEYKKGNLPVKSQIMIKNRIHEARVELKKKLKRYGS